MGIGGIGYSYGAAGWYGGYQSQIGIGGRQGYGPAALGQEPEGQTTGKVQGAQKTECQTCKNRKYQDGSDEMVSYKAATHISPQSAASAVRSHEQEHVSNAYKKAAMKGGKVLQASVKIQTGICPECGRTYVAGGTTTTRISVPKDTQYGKDGKSFGIQDQRGQNLDLAV